MRHQLGATYDLDATLAEARLASQFRIAGEIDARRAAEAMQLVRDRFEQARKGGDDMASVFVRARSAVLVQLQEYRASSVALADLTERDVDLGRSPRSVLDTAERVRALTLDQMRTALAELDLSRAAILLAGPHDVVSAMYGVLGRTPTFVAK